jgi:hypothetical protein
MTIRLIAIAAVAASVAPPASEPPARRPAAVPVTVAAPFPHISAARQLSDGRILVTDARTPALAILDPKTGRATRVGSAGAGDGQYVQPGGIYAGADGASLVLDRGLQRALVIDAKGDIARTYSIAKRGTSSAADDDLDLQRLDAGGKVYFEDLDARVRDRLAGGAATGMPVMRFDPAAQTGQTVARLREVESVSIPGGDGVTFRRGIIGSPADGYGVAPDGRVAVVRASPYRVEWHAPDGRVVQGPVIAHDALAWTDEEKKAIEAQRRQGPSVTSGATGGRTSGADLGLRFAPTKAPFEPGGVMVSPEGQVWVRRTGPFGARTTIYDVFDRTGARVDRLEIDAATPVVGFGPGVVLVREGVAGGVTLKAFRTR